MITPNIRQALYSEASNYADRDAYISDLALSSIWGDHPNAECIPPYRIALLSTIYDAAHATILSLIEQYGMSQTGFSRYFNIPLRSVQAWCGGQRQCPQYVIAMAAEILAADNGREEEADR